MTKLIMVVFILLISGCNTVKYVNVPVYTPIDITMPERPVLSSIGGTSYDIIGKNIEKDLIDLKSYSIQLESLLKDVSGKQGQKVVINK